MKKLEIYGVSDDLLEIDGDWSEEFCDYRLNEGRYLAFSDGTIIHAIYKGDWRISIVGEGSTVETTEILDTSPHCDYSNQVNIEGNFSWVAFVTEYKRIPKG